MVVVTRMLGQREKGRVLKGWPACEYMYLHGRGRNHGRQHGIGDEEWEIGAGCICMRLCVCPRETEARLEV